ncbi:MAG: purine-nucleoside phosphorylase [Deltaproteobacteria bacterium]|jgi:purine-nucleoside phosphorylase|nr:MAG: purine-nucleoside phosphorylase [Deltaproteobacteria bacterium]
MVDEIQRAADFLASKVASPPLIGMITGTGLESLTEKMEVDLRLPYEDIPHFPSSTTEGHKGTLVCGRLANRPVLAMEGRFHIYEGYSPKEITFPIRVMSKLGIQYLLISSAAGGLDPQFEPADLMIVTDHINLTGNNPLIGPNLDEFGPRFPDMSEVYDRDLITLAREKALETDISLRQGVYVGIIGPSLETPAETRFLRMIGADAVGMSTVSEVIVGVHCGLKIIVIVAITNVNLPDSMQKISIEKVITTANKAGPELALLWEKIISALP